MNIEKKQSIGTYLSSEVVRNSIENTIGDKNINAFVSQVVATVNTTPALQDCEFATIVQGALTAWVLDLPIVSGLGFSALVPFKIKDKNTGEMRKVAQFQIMTKGLTQLALRSGSVRTINVSDVVDGEIKKIDRLTGEIVFNWASEDRENKKRIGYVAYIELTNGYQKSFYMSDEQIKAHAKKYSQTFRAGFGVWFDDYDAMAKKTVLKLLLARYAPLTPETQRAISADQSIIDGGEIVYPDNPKMTLNEKADERHKERIERAIDEADTKEKAEALQEQSAEYGLVEKLNEKIKSLEKDVVVSADEAREILENKIKGSKFDYKKEE